jgi:cytochrome c oxidase subunit 2
MGIPAFHAVIEMEDTRTKADMVLKVTGLQWKWQYEYPDSGIKLHQPCPRPGSRSRDKEAKGENYLLEVDNEVVLPVGRKVRVLLTSTDVIHTWWVPQFGVKRDAIPGFLRETWVRIEEPGVYRGQCAELCGKDHGFMPVVVRAVPEPEYAAWVGQEKTEMAAAAAGSDRAWTKDELMAAGKAGYDKELRRLPPARRPGHPAGLPGPGGQQDRHRPAALAGRQADPRQPCRPRPQRQDRHRHAGLQGHPVRRRPGRHHHLRAQRLRQQQRRHDPARPDQGPSLRSIG